MIWLSFSLRLDNHWNQQLQEEWIRIPLEPEELDNEITTMLHHERLKPPPQDYTPDAWSLIEKKFHPEFIAQMERPGVR